jgi:glycosyltransferase involved in cell wall biosynthesis
MFKPQFSIIVGFRNRDYQRVKNSIDSLAAQTISDFELIFVDYGSDDVVSSQIKPLIEGYLFAKYIWSNTKGMFWSRAQAYNLGISQAIGKNIILWDIDLMVEPDFLEKLKEIDTSKVYTTHRCYYLPEEATKHNYKTESIISKSQHSYVGMCLVNANQLKEINGFDEYFQVWGAEDDDLYARLQNAGLERMQINATEIPVYHQWHPTQAPALPDTWYLQMLEYLYKHKNIQNSNTGKILSIENRPALDAFYNKTFKNGAQSELITWNYTFLYNYFVQNYHESPSGTMLYIDHSYPQLGFSAKAQKFINRFNELMRRRHRNFRLINLKQTERKQLKDNIYSFIKFFVGIHRESITDYYLDWREDGFIFIVIKK